MPTSAPSHAKIKSVPNPWLLRIAWQLADDDIDVRHACLCKFTDQFIHRSTEVRLRFKIRRETIDVHQRKYRDRKPAAKRNEMAQLVAACGAESGGSVDAVVSNHRDGSAVETNKAGDGSFQMSMMELATIRQHNIPVKIIVLKNNYLGMVREYQHYTYKDHYSVVDLSGSPDLEKLSAAYDIPYLRLNNMEHVDEILDAFLAEDNTMLLECLIDPMDLVK